MSFILSFIRVLKFAFQNFFRNFWLSFITMTIFVLTLLTVNTIIFINVMADAALRSAEQKVEVSIYFEPETSADIVLAAQGYLLGLTQVRDVKYISAEDSLEMFKTRHADNPVILSSLDEVDGNPFGDVLIVSAHAADDFPFILEAMDTPEYAPYIKEKDFTDYELIIERIHNLSQRIRIGGFALAAFFAIVAVMIIFNTIRVAIYVHRDEIGIMKLVGANDWFVRGPFLLEAIMYSFVACAFIFTAVVLALGGLEPWLISYFGEVDVSAKQYFYDNAVVVFGSQFLFLSVLSLLTTMYAMRRYLRV